MDFGSIIGLLNPLKWIEKGLKYSRRPILRIYFDASETFHTRRLADMNNIPGFFCHLMVSNDGKETAKECSLQLIQVEIRNQAGQFISHQDFLNPVVLKWAHESDFRPREIDPDIPRRLDLCLAVQSQPSFFSFATHKIPSGNRTDFPPGEYRVKVRVRSNNTKSTDGTYLVKYAGVWNQFEIAESS